MQRRRASKDTPEDSVNQKEDDSCDDKEAQGEDRKGGQ